MKIFDLEHRFFDPLWRRVLTSGVVGGWAVFEFVAGSAAWGMLFAGLGVYCVWSFFVKSRGT